MVARIKQVECFKRSRVGTEWSPSFESVSEVPAFLLTIPLTGSLFRCLTLWHSPSWKWSRMVGYRPTVGYAWCQCGSTSRLATGQIRRNEHWTNTVTFPAALNFSDAQRGVSSHRIYRAPAVADQSNTCRSLCRFPRLRTQGGTCRAGPNGPETRKTAMLTSRSRSPSIWRAWWAQKPILPHPRGG
jgi:hypothetical protein